ncbi:DUF4855 domain-containing protein [Sporosarcina gallistercoris]|uniref:DUF4855 domain-containing protein n=1 Tax=Sporosarcina gallistercoris TaxID=2762245 RepID=A0ABR8PM81_9BACL|nr:DUF4855 domain-containing protein [Sporosarcina gallistercoris]MBD7909285.1 DUF4855 domain-containing protein [Sporosarcina gallistercoris]
MKRIVTLFMVSAVFSVFLFSNAKLTQAALFKDVPHTYWAYEDIGFISSHGVVNGYTDGTFRAGEGITRKDAAIMMTRALDAPSVIRATVEVEDINPNSPGYSQIMTAVEKDWLSLYDNKFEPYALLTRDEMSKMIATAYDYKGKGRSLFSDVPETNVYYPYVDAIAYHEVTTGYKDGTFRPDVFVTRAQFSAFVARVYSKPVSYEVKSQGEVVATETSVEDALKIVDSYPKGTIHPKSNKFVEYAQTIGSSDKTGLNSGVLIYNGVKEKETFTPEFFNHYLTSDIGDGIRREMFDTFVILGLRYNTEGNMFTDSTSNHANYEDWQNYLDRTFSPDGAIHNLDSAARTNGRVVDAYISIPYPKRNESIISLDGKDLGTGLYPRYDLASWYVKETLKRFEREGYNNVKLKGFYWVSETVRTSEDEIIISSISSMLKPHKKYFIYSPHALSTNFHKWREYGFDGAFLQPNAFRTSIKDKENRLHQAFLNAQIYGTGITIEIDSYGLGQVASNEGVEAFNLYMDFAKRYGLDEKGMMFYQGVNMVERMNTIEHPVYKQWYNQLNTTFFNPK